MNAGSYGACKHGVRDIADDCRMTVNTVRKVLAKLVRFGVLSRTPGPFPNDPDHYTVEKMRDWDWDAVGFPKSKLKDEDLSSGRALLFLHSDIDEFGFTPYQLRLLAHITRRAGEFSRYRASDRYCTAGVRSMAKTSRISIPVTRRTLAELAALNVLYRSRPRGRAYADFYRIQPMLAWVCQTEAQKEIPKPIQTKPNVEDRCRKEGLSIQGSKGYPEGIRREYAFNARI